MADVVAMRAMFVRLGFSNQAAAAIADEQGIDSVPELAVLTDTDIEILCKVVRRPGGTVPNPNAGNAGQPPMLPNPGINVSLHAENPSCKTIIILGLGPMIILGGLRKDARSCLTT